MAHPIERFAHRPEDPTIGFLEYSDHNAEYLIDEENDPEHHRSRWHGRDGKTIISGDLGSECLRLKVRRS